MIAPRSRLLLWVAMLVLPCGLLSAVEPRLAAMALVAVFVLAALCLLDALRGRKVLQNIKVELPKVVRMTKDRSTSIEVRVCIKQPARKTLRFALIVPQQIESDPQELNVELPPDHEWSRFLWNCVPRKKGIYRLHSTCLEVRSPWGLWDVRGQYPVAAELRVYPNLLSERKNLAALFLNRGSFGLHVQRQVGKGREFEKLREYLPGDGFEDVHWKASAKRGRPVTKIFQIERTQEIYVILDASRLAARTFRNSTDWTSPPGFARPHSGTPIISIAEPVSALDRYIAAALVLGLAAEQQGDLFGLLAFSDKVDRFVRAKNGKTHFSACRDALYTIEPQTVTPDYEELFTFIRLRLRRRALLVVLTALDDPVLSESFTRNLELVCHQHLVLVNMIQPPGVGPLFEGAEPGSIDQIYQHLGGHLLWENLVELEKKLQRRGVKFSLLQDERLTVQLVHQYLNAKRRQAL